MFHSWVLWRDHVWATTHALSLNIIEYAEPSAFCTVEPMQSRPARGRISPGGSPNQQVLILRLSQTQAGWYEATPLTFSHRENRAWEEGKVPYSGTNTALQVTAMLDAHSFSLVDTKLDMHQIRYGFTPKMTARGFQTAHLLPLSLAVFLFAGLQWIGAFLVGWLTFTTAQEVKVNKGQQTLRAMDEWINLSSAVVIAFI